MVLISGREILSSCVLKAFLGTAVGAYFVNMFPDRVGRVLIDGVVVSRILRLPHQCLNYVITGASLMGN